jgi:hypothetical protein
MLCLRQIKSPKAHSRQSSVRQRGDIKPSREIYEHCACSAGQSTSRASLDYVIGQES